MKARYEEADGVDDNNDGYNHVVIEELSGVEALMEELFLLSVILWCMEEAVESAHVRKSDLVSFVSILYTVCGLVNDSNDHAQQSWQSLAVEADKEDLQCTGFLWFPHFSEFVGHVDGHCVHPHEEADEGVVAQVAQELAGPGSVVVCLWVEVQASVDPVQNEIDGDIEEESYGDFPKQLLSQILENQVDSQGQKHEET